MKFSRNRQAAMEPVTENAVTGFPVSRSGSDGTQRGVISDVYGSDGR